MRFYKECACGKRNEFENRSDAPQYCFECNRSLYDISATDTQKTVYEDVVQTVVIEENSGCNGFVLREIHNTFTIKLISPECIVGRSFLGQDDLENHHAISRKHIRVTHRNSFGVMIEDLSTFGTFLNNVRLVKGTTNFAGIGDSIKLHDVEFILVEGSNDENE